MELKRLVSHFTYKIESKPEGGFIARASDPSAPPLEAPTRDELQQKIQSNIAATLAAEFPGLKLPAENQEAKFAFHIEHKPDGGFILQSSDGTALPVVGGTHAEIQNKLAEKILGALGKQFMPELSQALLAQAQSGDVKVVVNRTVKFSTNSIKPMFGNAAASPADNAQSTNLLNGANAAITPESSGLGRIAWFLLAALVFAVVVYFLRFR